MNPPTNPGATAIDVANILAVVCIAYLIGTGLLSLLEWVHG